MIEVVVGVLSKSTSRDFGGVVYLGVGDVYLTGRRPPFVAHSDLWEFPGGKVEAGETHQEALAREWMEEMGATVEVHDLLYRHDFDGEWRLANGGAPAYRVYSYRVTCDQIGIHSWSQSYSLALPPAMNNHANLHWLTVGQLRLLSVVPSLEAALSGGHH